MQLLPRNRWSLLRVKFNGMDASIGCIPSGILSLSGGRGLWTRSPHLFMAPGRGERASFIEMCLFCTVAVSLFRERLCCLCEKFNPVFNEFVLQWTYLFLSLHPFNDYLLICASFLYCQPARRVCRLIDP